jgi:hypothetical protein
LLDRAGEDVEVEFFVSGLSGVGGDFDAGGVPAELFEESREIAATAADVDAAFFRNLVFDQADAALVHGDDTLQLAGIVAEEKIIIFAVESGEFGFVQARGVEEQAAGGAATQREWAGVMVLGIGRRMEKLALCLSAAGAGLVVEIDHPRE